MKRIRLIMHGISRVAFYMGISIFFTTVVGMARLYDSQFDLTFIGVFMSGVVCFLVYGVIAGIPEGIVLGVVSVWAMRKIPIFEQTLIFFLALFGLLAPFALLRVSSDVICVGLVLPVLLISEALLYMYEFMMKRGARDGMTR